MINPILEQSIIAFLARTEEISHLGQRMSADELQELQSKLTIPLPDWYFEFFSSFPIAGLSRDNTGGGDPYFMKVTEGDNPPVYQVYHDVGVTATDIEQRGMLRVAASLAEFFDKARV